MTIIFAQNKQLFKNYSITYSQLILNKSIFIEAEQA